VTKGDTARVFLISLSDGGLPYAIADGCLAMISIKRPTGTSLEAFCAIEKGTIIKYDFEQNEKTAVVEGVHDCSVTLYNAEGRAICSPKFTMIVSERVVNKDDLIVTDDDVTAINAMLAAEVSRQTAEEARGKSEAIRITAEEARATAETARVAAERARAEAASQIHNEISTFGQDLRDMELTVSELYNSVNGSIELLSDVVDGGAF
jgi:hypothetical protein